MMDPPCTGPKMEGRKSPGRYVVEARGLFDRMKSPWELSGERRSPQTQRYLKVRPDKHGRLLAERPRHVME